MNGYNDIHTEPSDDEEFAIACGYEIISEEDLYDLIALSYRDQCYTATGKAKQGKGFKFPFFSSKRSSASLSSMASSGVSSMAKPMSSCSLSSQASDMSEDFSSQASSGVPESLGDYEDEVDRSQLSVENLWYMIQQKRHNHHDFEGEEGMDHHHFMTMEHHAPNKKMTEWLSNLLHFPEKLKQIAADKHRFNINKVSKEVRDELKHIYVY